MANIVVDDQSPLPNDEGNKFSGIEHVISEKIPVHNPQADRRPSRRSRQRRENSPASHPSSTALLS